VSDVSRNQNKESKVVSWIYSHCDLAELPEQVVTFWHLGLYDSAVNFRDLYRTVSIDEACRESVIDWQSEAGLQITSLFLLWWSRWRRELWSEHWDKVRELFLRIGRNHLIGMGDHGRHVVWLRCKMLGRPSLVHHTEDIPQSTKLVPPFRLWAHIDSSTDFHEFFFFTILIRFKKHFSPKSSREHLDVK